MNMPQIPQIITEYLCNWDRFLFFRFPSY